MRARRVVQLRASADAAPPQAPVASADAGANGPSAAAKVVLYASCSFVSLVVLEHVSRVLELKHTPLVLLDGASVRARALFTWLGAALAYASSFLERLRLDEIVATVSDSGVGTLKFVTAPVWFVYGYTHQVFEYAAHAWVTWLGSALLLGALAYAARAHLARAGAWARAHAVEIVGAAAACGVLYWAAWDVSLLELVAPRLRATLRAL